MLLEFVADAPERGGLKSPAYHPRRPCANHAGDWVSLLGRFSFVQPVLLAIRVGKTSDPDSYAAINLHYEGSGWKLSGIALPKAAVHDLAASLPVK
jgi:hypothetical protein